VKLHIYALRHLVIASVLIGTPIAAQQQFQNLEKGFQPEKVYQFGDVDSVNVFNGNVVIALPLGLTYPLNGGLSYQLILSYNSKSWDVLDKGAGKFHAIPARRSNAGIGWIVSMGRYVPHDDATNQSGFQIYEAPDGGDHMFNGDDSRTTDGTNLRIRTVSASTVEIDFPDGTVQQFVKNQTIWSLRQLRSEGSPDTVSISALSAPTALCQPTGANSEISITDSRSRSHAVCFSNLTVDGEPRAMVSTIVVTGPPNAAQPNAAQLKYVFNYDSDVLLYRPSEDVDPDPSRDGKHTAPLLRSISSPDGSKYRFGYEVGSPIINKVTLPTLAEISYQYGDRLIPSQTICANNYGLGYGFGSKSAGVISRTVTTLATTASPLSSQVTTYTPELTPQYISTYNCETDLNAAPIHPTLYDELVVKVQGPDGHRTDNHFSVFASEGDLSPAGFKRQYFGLPYGRYDSGQNRYLSQESFECVGSSCNRKRSTWVRHDLDPDLLVYTLPSGEPNAPSRQASQRTVFLDDGPSGCVDSGTASPCRWVESDSTGWDGYGHYRTVTTNSNFQSSSLTRTVATDWNTTLATPRTFAPGDKWILNTYQKVVQSEGNDVDVAHACFDLTTGFLKATRRLAGVVPASWDQVATFEKNVVTMDGNLQRERHYGGDDRPLPSDANQTYLCNALASLGSPRYEISHTWQNGMLATSQYTGSTFLSTDRTIHLSGVVTESRDTSLRPTTYTFDTQGRLYTVQPPGSAATTYSYTNASGNGTTLTTPAKVSIQVGASGTASNNIKAEYLYDSLGRLWREKTMGFDGSWAVRETLYDNAGRKASTSELVALSSDTATLTASPTRFQNYDAFGRPGKIIAPDGAETRFGYVGNRLKTRTSRVWTGLDADNGLTGEQDTAVTVTEEYDGFGRLILLSENSGPSGVPTISSYAYGVGDRLNAVKMTGSENVQNRFFDYDGSGLLRWESHPESGITSYSYDARGHLISKIQSAAKTHFDQTYEYDSSERLRKVWERDPYAWQTFRLLKEFTFAPDNVPVIEDGVPTTDYLKGKLFTATRYNYPYPGSLHGDTVTVQETYGYRDAAGRRTHRFTSIHDTNETPYPVATQRNTYNELGLLASVTYPKCENCGFPGYEPGRELSHTYAYGRLTALSDFIGSISYWPNGMRNELSHSNGIIDRQTVDATGIARPASLSSGLYNSCTGPSIVAQSNGGVVSPSPGSAGLNLSVTASGTAPLSYKWFADGFEISGQTGPSLPVHPSVTTNYRVDVTNTCSTNNLARSASMKVLVEECAPPVFTATTASRNTDGTFTLRASAVGNTTISYQWYRLAGNQPLAPGATVQIGALTASTNFEVKASNGCGDASAIVTAEVTVPLTNALVASRTDSNQIRVSWPVSADAEHYDVERRSGGGWGRVFVTAGTEFIDTSVSSNRTYAYRVTAARIDSVGDITTASAPSNVDVATTMEFTDIGSGSVTTSAANHLEEILDAVNYARAAASWAQVTWTNILAPSDPLPSPGVAIRAKHILALRARMNEALQALGVPVTGYTDAELVGTALKATHIKELQAKAK
jgi:YD repeat-containing protein